MHKIGNSTPKQEYHIRFSILVGASLLGTATPQSSLTYFRSLRCGVTLIYLRKLRSDRLQSWRDCGRRGQFLTPRDFCFRLVGLAVPHSADLIHPLPPRPSPSLSPFFSFTSLHFFTHINSSQLNSSASRSIHCSFAPTFQFSS